MEAGKPPRAWAGAALQPTALAVVSLCDLEGGGRGKADKGTIKKGMC